MALWMVRCVTQVPAAVCAGELRVTGSNPSWKPTSMRQGSAASKTVTSAQLKASSMDGDIATSLRILASAIPTDESQHLQQLICSCNAAVNYLHLHFAAMPCNRHDSHPVHGTAPCWA